MYKIWPLTKLIKYATMLKNILNKNT